MQSTLHLYYIIYYDICLPYIYLLSILVFEIYLFIIFLEVFLSVACVESTPVVEIELNNLFCRLQEEIIEQECGIGIIKCLEQVAI